MPIHAYLELIEKGRLGFGQRSSKARLLEFDGMVVRCSSSDAYKVGRKLSIVLAVGHDLELKTTAYVLESYPDQQRFTTVLSLDLVGVDIDLVRSIQARLRAEAQPA